MSVLSITYYFVSNMVFPIGQMHHHLFIHFSTDKNIGLNTTICPASSALVLLSTSALSLAI